MILICAIRDHFYDTGNKDDAETINRDFIFTTTRRTHEKFPKLTLNENDRDFFEKRILSYPDDENRRVKPIKISHDLILKSFENVGNHVRKIIGEARTPTEKLHDWIDYIEKS